ncbi:hypothetical protein C8R44DRAFT_864760 [Mycena epipterygia]|nr:hypothetical protein C8R44DRAFT_864760 [Mycena epipterygia]
MKFFSSLLVSAALAGSALAQSIAIGAPASGTTVTAGSNITVQVVHPLPVPTPGSAEASIIIGFLASSSSSNQIGNILYDGPYNPVIHITGPGPANKAPFEDFTVTIPATASAGSAQLSVTHLNLIQPGPQAVVEHVGITLVVT